MALLDIKNLHKSYFTGSEELKVLRGLSLKMEKGEIVMVMGPSGSGKTTLLNLVGGIDTDYSGRIVVDGRELGKMNERQLTEYRRKKVGFIFQFYNLLPTLTAQENVELAMEASGMARGDVEKRALKYLELVELKEKAKNFPQELSGGEQQRVAIARALAKHPKLILADEPTGNVDEEREENIMRLMRHLSEELNMTFLIVSHNSRLRKFMDRTLYLRYGVLKEREKQ